MTEFIDGEAVHSGGSSRDNNTAGPRRSRDALQCDALRAGGNFGDVHASRGYVPGNRSDTYRNEVHDSERLGLYGHMGDPAVAIALGRRLHDHSMRTGADFPEGAVDLLSDLIEAGDPTCAVFVTWLAKFGHSGADFDESDDGRGGDRNA